MSSSLSRMLFATLVASISLAVFAWPSVATACDCFSPPPEALVERAELVFVGRAGALSTAARRQPYEVLTVLQGAPHAPGHHELDFAPRIDDCDHLARTGDIALVVVIDGKTSGCDGSTLLTRDSADRFARHLELAGATVPTTIPRARLVDALAPALDHDDAEEKRFADIVAVITDGRVETGEVTVGAHTVRFVDGADDVPDGASSIVLTRALAFDDALHLHLDTGAPDLPIDVLFEGESRVWLNYGERLRLPETEPLLIPASEL